MRRRGVRLPCPSVADRLLRHAASSQILRWPQVRAASLDGEWRDSGVPVGSPLTDLGQRQGSIMRIDQNFGGWGAGRGWTC